MNIENLLEAIYSSKLQKYAYYYRTRNLFVVSTSDICDVDNFMQGFYEI